MTKPRHVRGLIWAKEIPESPWKTSPKLSGRAAEGIRFQQKVHEDLRELARYGELKPEIWIQYRDTYGIHYCSPDDVLVLPNRVMIVESKLSLRRYETARTQLKALYKPVLEYIYQRPTILVLAFKHFCGNLQDLTLVPSLEDLLYERPGNEIFGWHKLHG